MHGPKMKNPSTPLSFVYSQLVYLCTSLLGKHRIYQRMTNDFATKAILKLLMVSGVLAIFHVFLINNVLPPIYGAGPYWSIYIVLIPLSVITILVAVTKYKKDKTAVGKVYIVSV